MNSRQFPTQQAYSPMNQRFSSYPLASVTSSPSTSWNTSKFTNGPDPVPKTVNMSQLQHHSPSLYNLQAQEGPSGTYPSLQRQVSRGGDIRNSSASNFESYAGRNSMKNVKTEKDSRSPSFMSLSAGDSYRGRSVQGNSAIDAARSLLRPSREEMKDKLVNSLATSGTIGILPGYKTNTYESKRGTRSLPISRVDNAPPKGGLSSRVPSPVARAQAAIGRTRQEINNVRDSLQQSNAKLTGINRHPHEHGWISPNAGGIGNDLSSLKKMKQDSYRRDLENQMEQSRLRKEVELKKEKDGAEHPLGPSYNFHSSYMISNTESKCPAISSLVFSNFGSTSYTSGKEKSSWEKLSEEASFTNNKKSLAAVNDNSSVGVVPCDSWNEKRFSSQDTMIPNNSQAFVPPKPPQLALPQQYSNIQMHPQAQSMFNQQQSPRPVQPNAQLQYSNSNCYAQGIQPSMNQYTPYPYGYPSPPQLGIPMSSTQQQYQIPPVPPQQMPYPDFQQSTAPTIPYPPNPQQFQNRTLNVPHATCSVDGRQGMNPPATRREAGSECIVESKVSPRRIVRLKAGGVDTLDLSSQDELDVDEGILRQHVWQTSDQLPSTELKQVIYKNELKKQIIQKQLENMEKRAKEMEEDEKLDRSIQEYQNKMKKQMETEQLIISLKQMGKSQILVNHEELQKHSKPKSNVMSPHSSSRNNHRIIEAEKQRRLSEASSSIGCDEKPCASFYHQSNVDHVQKVHDALPAFKENKEEMYIFPSNQALNTGFEQHKTLSNEESTPISSEFDENNHRKQLHVQQLKDPSISETIQETVGRKQGEDDGAGGDIRGVDKNEPTAKTIQSNSKKLMKCKSRSLRFIQKALETERTRMKQLISSEKGE